MLDYRNETHRQLLKGVTTNFGDIFSKGMGGNDLSATTLGESYNVLLTGRFSLSKADDGTKRVRVECVATIAEKRFTWNVRPTQEIATLLSSSNPDDIARVTSTPFTVQRGQLQSEDGTVIDFVAFKRGNEPTQNNVADVAAKFGINLNAEQPQPATA